MAGLFHSCARERVLLVSNNEGETMTTAIRGFVAKTLRQVRHAARGSAIGCIGLLAGANVAGAGTAPADAPAADSPADAGADQGTSSGLQEIVVTSQKRTESLQDVPLSVAAISAEELQRRNISSIGDLMGGQVPSLRIEPFAGNPTVLEVAIRGFIDSNGVNITNENPVPIYIDDVYYGRQSAMSLQLTEIQRIEVLRGPQGTLFGRNAEGGAVRIVSKDPTGELGLRQKIETGNFGYWNATTHLDLPSVAGVATKIDFLATNNHGWQTNSAPGQDNFGKLKSLGARFTALWKPTDNFSAEYSYDWTQLKSTEVFNQQLASNDLFQHLFTPAGVPTGQTIWPTQTSTATSIPYPVYRPLDNQKFTGHRLQANWTLSPEVSVKSITSYRDDSSPLWNTASTSASVPALVFGPLGAGLGYLSAPTVLYDINHNQFSQEFQLTGTEEHVTWVAGLFYFNEHGSQLEKTYFGTSFPNAQLTFLNPAPGIFIPAPVSMGNAVALDPPFAVPGSMTGALVHNRSYAAYGQATWRPAGFDQFSLTGGVRVGRDEKDATRPTGGVWNQVTYPDPVTQQIPAPNFDCTVTPRPAQCTSSYSQTKVLPMASIAYDWTKDLNTYVRYSTGYQTAVVGLASQTFKPVKASTVDSFELGAKAEFFGHRARINAAVFYLNWKDPQENVQTASSSTVEYFTGPTIHTSGLELDTSFLPLDNLTLNVALNYLHGSQAVSVNPFPNPNVPVSAPVTNQLIEMPKFTGSVSMLWDIARTAYGRWHLDVDVNGTSRYYTVPQSTQTVPEYTLLNARFGLAEIQTGTGRVDVSLWGRNLTNKSYETFLYNFPASVPLNPQAPLVGTAASFGQPRTYGIAVNVAF
jgi:iron complex outermembrane receptor protein